MKFFFAANTAWEKKQEQIENEGKTAYIWKLFMVTGSLDLTSHFGVTLTEKKSRTKWNQCREQGKGHGRCIGRQNKEQKTTGRQDKFL